MNLKLLKKKNKERKIMAKFKFSDARITDILAILDRNEEGKFILTMDDEQYDFEAIMSEHVGDTIKCTFTRDIE